MRKGRSIDAERAKRGNAKTLAAIARAVAEATSRPAAREALRRETGTDDGGHGG